MSRMPRAGVQTGQFAIALVKVIDDEREKEARGYLKSAKLEALPTALLWNKTTHDIATDGRAVTEAPVRAVAKEAQAGRWKKWLDMLTPFGDLRLRSASARRGLLRPSSGRG